MTTIMESLQAAIESPTGIALKTTTWGQAVNLRRRLYAVRDRLRLKGNCQFDHLSFVITESGELFILKRNELTESKNQHGYGIRPLDIIELPRTFAVRGKSRLKAFGMNDKAGEQ